MSNPTVPIPATAPKPVAAGAKIDPDVDLAKLLSEVAALRAAEDQRQKQEVAKLSSTFEAKVAQPVKKEVDWSKVNERDIFNMDIPVDTIEHSLATYLDVQLVDQNYVARWVNVKVHNLGPRVKTGWRFVTQADLDPKFPHPLDFDTNGRYSFDDVVCMMIPKRVYYAKLKMNYNRATTIQRKREVRPKDGIPGLTDEGPIQQALQRGAMEFYEPNAPNTNMEQI